MRSIGASVVFGVGMLGMVLSAPAQSVDTVGVEAQTIARFTGAQALAVDPAGTIYVVDGADNVLVLLSPAGLRLAVYGGPGSAEGEFDQPADVDPTNGLLWVVADAGNGRLQRFSRTFTHLESLPVRSSDLFRPGHAARTVHVREHSIEESGKGYPVAVAVNAATETFAIDEVQRVVLKWDASRRLERSIGGYSAGQGALVEPVALATGEDALYVADRGQQAVLVYDFFGSYIRTLAAGRAADVRALTVVDSALWIVLPDRILVYEPTGRLQREVHVLLDEPLRDADSWKGRTYLLTSTQLLVRASGGDR